MLYVMLMLSQLTYTRCYAFTPTSFSRIVAEMCVNSPVPIDIGQ